MYSLVLCFAGKYRIIREIISLKIVNVILIHYFKADKERTRLCRSVKITGIAEFSLIQIFLKTIEDVLHARIQLEFDVVVQHERIIQLQIEAKNWGVFSMRSFSIYPA